MSPFMSQKMVPFHWVGMGGAGEPGTYLIYLEPETSIYQRKFQLDEEPNLYIKSAWKSPFPPI